MVKTDVVMVTGDMEKIRQAQALFQDSVFNLRKISDFGCSESPIKNGHTIQHNAIIKARFGWHRLSGNWIVGEDTELSIPALGGKPGVLTARWAGLGATDNDIMHYCLRKMANVSDRRAYFRTVVSVFDPRGGNGFFIGEVAGSILPEPRGTLVQGMPYSTIFEVTTNRKVWAEMDLHETNEVCHRAQALKSALSFMENFQREESPEESL